jgi:integrase-like protein
VLLGELHRLLTCPTLPFASRCLRCRMLRDARRRGWFHCRLVLPAESPNLNAYAERFMRTIKEECVNRLIFFGQGMLCWAIDNFIEHYHTERNHQGLKNKHDGEIQCRERLGGLLKYYHRVAA